MIFNNVLKVVEVKSQDVAWATCYAKIHDPADINSKNLASWFGDLVQTGSDLGYSCLVNASDRYQTVSITNPLNNIAVHLDLKFNGEQYSANVGIGRQRRATFTDCKDRMLDHLHGVLDGSIQLSATRKYDDQEEAGFCLAELQRERTIRPTRYNVWQKV